MNRRSFIKSIIGVFVCLGDASEQFIQDFLLGETNVSYIILKSPLTPDACEKLQKKLNGFSITDLI